MANNTMRRQPLAPVTANVNVNVNCIDELASSMASKLHIVPSLTKTSKEDIYVDEEDDGVANEKVDWEKERKDMDKLFEKQVEEQLQGLEPFNKPNRLKKSAKVYEHQMDGIRWLVAQGEFLIT
jgi:vacuolar-type H+-ATPase subunit I/STV1